MKIFNFDITALHAFAQRDDDLIANHVESVVPKIVIHLKETVCFVLDQLDEAVDAEDRKPWESDRDELLEVLRFYYNKAVKLGVSTVNFNGLEVHDFTDAFIAQQEWGKMVEKHGLGNCNVQSVNVEGSSPITRIMVLNSKKIS